MRRRQQLNIARGPMMAEVKAWGAGSKDELSPASLLSSSMSDKMLHALGLSFFICKSEKILGLI